MASGERPRSITAPKPPRRFGHTKAMLARPNSALNRPIEASRERRKKSRRDTGDGRFASRGRSGSGRGTLPAAASRNTPSDHGHTKLNPGPRKKAPMTVRIMKNISSIVKSTMAILRSPGLVLGFRSAYGSTNSSTKNRVGTITPATMGWKYRRSSWRPRKYQGAFDGFGVRFGLASSRSGALTNVENTIRAAVTMMSESSSWIRRWGNVLTRSPCSRSTRWTPSGATRARSRCLSGAPGFGEGTFPVGGGATSGAAGGGATAIPAGRPAAAAGAGAAAGAAAAGAAG